LQVSPTHAIVAVTYRCNARCVMCDIWKRARTPEMAPADYGRLPPSLREINVSGGEPLLRRDLAQVIEVMQQTCPGVRIIISTNGLLPEVLDEVLGRVDGVAVRVSVDGIGDLHDEIRGVDRAFEKVLASIEVCRKHGISDLGVCATMIRQNAGRVTEVYEFAERGGLQFTFTVAHSSETFFGDKDSEQPSAEAARGDIDRIKARLFASRSIKDWFRAYFVEGLMDVLKGRPRPIECRAGTDFFYLDPEGRIYPCHLWDKEMGNILEQTYEEIVASNRGVIEAVGRCRKKCWMTCTVAPEMRRKLLLYGARVAWAKVLHHAGKVHGAT
jgi:MoaA/NifB/PqqE/SkfB family radical SAM enzyme